MSHANLSHANLSHANLSHAKLYYTDLSGANLSGANFDNAKLIETKLQRSNLSGAKFSNINSGIGTDFASDHGRFYVDLSNANLSNATVIGSDLSYAIIIDPSSFHAVKGDDKSDFSQAIITDDDFGKELRKFTTKVSETLSNKEDLIKRGERGDFDRQLMGYLLNISKLPEK